MCSAQMNNGLLLNTYNGHAIVRLSETQMISCLITNVSGLRASHASSSADTAEADTDVAPMVSVQAARSPVASHKMMVPCFVTNESSQQQRLQKEMELKEAAQAKHNGKEAKDAAREKKQQILDRQRSEEKRSREDKKAHKKAEKAKKVKTKATIP